MRTRCCVLGAGSWGTSVAALLSRNADVTLWARDAGIAEEINRTHRNARYLPDVELPSGLRSSASLPHALLHCDLLVVAVPSHGFRLVLEQAQPLVPARIPAISLSKGLEQRSQLRMSEIIAEVLPGRPVGVLSGPNLAREIMTGMPAASVLAMSEPGLAARLQALFSSSRFRVYSNDDVIGCEVAGALKNVIAIACGMQEEFGVGDNTRAMTITRGLMELTRLGIAMGGRPSTFIGMAGIGDLLATCLSPHSRNHYVGVELARGRSIDAITASMQMVAEGVRTSSVVRELARRHGVEMPIAEEVCQVVHEGKPPLEAFRSLQRIAPGAETEPG